MNPAVRPSDWSGKLGCWIYRTPFVVILLLCGLLGDSVIRMLLTMASQYYRLIEIPEALVFGVFRLTAGHGRLCNAGPGASFG